MNQKAKQFPRMTGHPMLQRQQSLGADRDTPGMCHSCTHLNKILRNLSSWLFQATQQHPEPRKCLRTLISSRVPQMSSYSHGPVSVTLPVLSTAEHARLRAKGCQEQGPHFMEVLCLLPFWQILNIALFSLCMTVFFNTPHNLNVCPPTANWQKLPFH